MATTTKQALGGQSAAPTGSALLEARPFARLSAAKTGALSAAAVRGLQDLRSATEDAAPILAAALVRFSFSASEPLNLIARKPPTTSVLNRRRRSARLWVNSILGGHWDRETLKTLRNVWLPQLAGTGHQPEFARGTGVQMVEYLRGAISSWILVEPEANLVPRARALHSLDSILAVHLRAFLDPVAAVLNDSPSR